MNFKNEIILASIVRKSSEELVKSKVKGFENFDNDLMGMCGISSLALKDLLDKNGINANLAQGHYRDFAGHCWVDVENHCIDITLTQFGYKEKINIIHKHSKMFEKFNEVKKEANYMDFKAWPYYQKPQKRLVDTILDHAVKSGYLSKDLKCKTDIPCFSSDEISVV